MTQATFEVPPFARACLDRASSIWEASFVHPFVTELARGTLPSEIFKFYQMQDARYLEAFADTSILVALRCSAPSDKLWFIDAAKLALEVEGQLHAGYGKKLGYSPKDVAELELTPNNRAYQDHMVATATRGSLLEAVAALTPCPWLYVALGQHLARTLGDIPETHPYAEWLKMYSDPAFNEFMDNLLARLQRFSDQADPSVQRRAIDAFVTSVRYEWLFWQQAWERQSWPQ